MPCHKARDWESWYRNERVENMPWYNKNLDNDLKRELEDHGIKRGRLLDLGSGPGTQAALIANMGFEVTGSDISSTAVKDAQKRFPEVDFRVDDILETNLPPNSFDYVFDRGCFHTIPPRSRHTYVRAVSTILRENGLLFLKCFSTKEKRDKGPYRFTVRQIKKLFEDYFTLQDHRETVFETPPDLEPKALFFVMARR